MDLQTYALLCASALAAGVMNSLAGGGTLLTFPALFAALGGTAEASVLANQTSTVALVPGSIAGTWGFRRELREADRWSMILLVPSVLGSIVGSILVLELPDKVFKNLVPWLILTAATLFLLQPYISRWLGLGSAKAGEAAPPPSGGGVVAVCTFQFFVAVYGGYFGAGIGILMLSALALMGAGDVLRMNALKNLLASVINTVSVMIFLFRGEIHWPYAGAMAGASIAGGLLGSMVGRHLNRTVLRWLIITVGFSLSAFYLHRQYGG